MVPEIIQLKQKSALLLSAALLLLLAGCASVATQPTARMPGAIISGTTTPDTSTKGGQPVEGGTAAQEPLPAASGNQAVIALLDKARQDTGSGQREAAGASLERALRIEPRNAWLWHELAQLRLSQGQYAQAVSLAQKSNSFSGRERRLQALNWRIIGNARVAQGNHTGAEQALKLAAELEQ